jgi:hypothetical protein
MHRRQYIAAAGTAATIALAGCSGGGSDTGSPEAVVEAWINLQDGGASESDIEEAKDLLHSASPLLEVIEEGNTTNTTDEDISIDSVETEVTEENLSESELEEEFQFLFGGAPGFEAQIDNETKSTIAEENAVVEATVERSGDDVSEDRQETTTNYLVATEDGEWQIISTTAAG